jgi:hypothetical protein
LSDDAPPEAVRVRVLDLPLVWVLVRESVGPIGPVVELAAAGRRLVVPKCWCRRTDEQPTIRAVV